MRIGVKICGLTRPADVEAAIQAGADAIGVVFDRGPCRVSESTARELLAAARGALVERVAVVGSAPPEARQRTFDLGFDLVQAVAAEPLWSAPMSPPLLPAFFDGPDLLRRVAAWRDRRAASPARAGRLLGTLNVDGMGGGGTGRRADWTRARAVAEAGPVTLSGGLTVANLEAALRAVGPWAVDVSSGVEAAPGIKDRARMSAFVREVRRLEEVLAEAA